jgi:protein AaeX
LKFAEIDLFGVYVAPISLLMVAAWLVTIALRRVAGRFDLLRYVWHPALLVFAVYIIVLSSMMLSAPSASTPQRFSSVLMIL